MGTAIRMRSGILISAATAVAVYTMALLVPPLAGQPGPLRALRTAFWHDQLGYLSIVANASAGRYDVVEPMTLTGVNHYPRTYYVAVGAIADVFELHPVVAWNAVSLTLQVGAIATLAVTMSLLARHWWVGALAPVPYLVGTLSIVTNGTWNTPLDSHAVLWGPYGVLFSQNAETAGLSIIVIVICAIALVWLRPARRPTRIVTGLAGAAALGLLSGFQTYSFLTGAYLFAAVLAAVFLWGARWWWWTASGIALVVVLVAGPVVADRAGQLPTLVFGLLFTVPGLIRGVIRTRGMLALYGGVMTICAAPPIIWTLSGILEGDPFLTYRVASNHDLGVAHRETFIATLPVALPMLLLLLIAARRRDRIALPVLAATSLCALVLALNDQWGANAEPYRFWIDMFLLCGVVSAIVACTMAGRPAETPAARPVRIGFRVGAVACAAVYLLSLADVSAFATDPEMTATWDPTTSREQAVERAAREAGSGAPGLIATDECVDPRTTKVTSQQAMAYYYLGMAWPAEVDAVGGLVAGRLDGALHSDDVASSGTRWLLTDSACAPIDLDGVEVSGRKGFAYEGGEIILQRLEVR